MNIYSNLTFDSVAINSISGIEVLSVDTYLPAKRKLSLSNIARSNKSKLNSSFYEKKEIAVRVSVSGNSRDTAEQSLDNLMAILQGDEKWLVVPQSGGTRKYLCTYSDFNAVNGGGSYIELELMFELSDRFGYDTSETTLLAVSNHTSATKSNSITLAGSAPWQVPKITLTINAVSGGTGATVSFGNNAVGQQVDISRDWIANDVLVIDAYERLVTVNGIEVDFTGAIPEWTKGEGFIYYQDNFTTSRNVSYTVTYSKRWV